MKNRSLRALRTLRELLADHRIGLRGLSRRSQQLRTVNTGLQVAHARTRVRVAAFTGCTVRRRYDRCRAPDRVPPPISAASTSRWWLPSSPFGPLLGGDSDTATEPTDRTDTGEIATTRHADAGPGLSAVDSNTWPTSTPRAGGTCHSTRCSPRLRSDSRGPMPTDAAPRHGPGLDPRRPAPAFGLMLRPKQLPEGSAGRIAYTGARQRAQAVDATRRARNSVAGTPTWPAAPRDETGKIG